jgi:hypothetical protein
MVWVGWTTDENADGMVQGEELKLDPGVEGVGRPILLREVEILPTPLVQGLGGVSGEVQATGNTEAGIVTISQISVGYTEDQLHGLIAEFRDPTFPDTLKPGVSFFYEIQENRPSRYAIKGTAAYSQFGPSDLRSPRRRFHLTSAPTHIPDAFQWTISLTRADGERNRDGNVQGVSGVPYEED